jgi:hypothetical protein
MIPRLVTHKASPDFPVRVGEEWTVRAGPHGRAVERWIVTHVSKGESATTFTVAIEAVRP